MILSLDSETTGIDLRHGVKPFFVTFCDEEGINTWFEWSVNPFTRQPDIPDGDLDEIQALIDSADELVLHNAKFDFSALQQVFDGRLAWDWGKVSDTLYSAHLLASNQVKDLTSQALIYLGVNIKPLEDALEKAVREARREVEKRDFVERHGEWRLAKKGDPQMPSAKEKTWRFDYWLPRAVAAAEEYTLDHPWWTVLSEYSNADSAVTLRLFKAHQKLIEREGLGAIYRERLKLLPIAAGMEDRGITLNGDRLDELLNRYTAESLEAERVCVGIAGRFGFDLSLPKSGNNGSLKKFMVEGLKLPPVAETDRGEQSFNKTAMDVYETTLPDESEELQFVRSLKDKRSRDTAGLYLRGYQRFWKHVKKSWFRLHPNLNVVGTDTLRWSSNNPNSQNISKREGFNLRYVFGPAPGFEWWALDYENLELRLPAYESGEQAMIEIFENPDNPPYFGSYHLLNASIVYPDLFWPLADQKGAFKETYKSTWYQWIKNFGFAVGYGAMLGSGTADRAAHKSGAQQMVMEHLKEHSALNQKWIDFANQNGYVETLPDKTVCEERGYPLSCTRSQYGKVSPTVPLNFHIQGSAMWATMKAMIRCSEYLKNKPAYRMVAQVHDEIVFEMPANGKKNLPIVNELKRLMELSGDDFGIPLTVSASYHPRNWSEEDKLK